MTYDPLLKDIRLRIRDVMTTSGSYIEVKVYDAHGNFLGELAFNRAGGLIDNRVYNTYANRFPDYFVDAISRELRRTRLLST
ncbi:MAG: hypothetical protein F7B17_02230 [Desulfurococcales archaeon]|nr:hypothetical protein [Desulfurococcales archaeon]